MFVNSVKSLARPILFSGALFLGAQANAASISFYLDQSNVLPDGLDYAQVTISDGLIAGNIDFSVAVIGSAFAVSPGANFGIQTFSFNYDTSLTVTAGNITGISPASWLVSEDANAGGGFGKFEFRLSGNGSSRTRLLNFSLTGVAGDSINSYASGSALKPSSAYFFATQIAGFDTTSGVTGAQFSGASPAVPAPAAFWLFGTGLLGLIAVARGRS